MLKRILIIGLGDLGKRIATGLAIDSGEKEIVLASRQEAKHSSFVNLLKISSKNNVRFIPLDASDQRAAEKVIRSVKPTLIVQCASLLSPWYVGRRSRAAGILRTAGFAAQLPAQIPLTLAIMKAVAETGLRLPVINCSYPDIVNPVLSRLNLAPSIGIGNVSMIAAKVQAVLRQTAADPNAISEVRVVAHHAHVTGAMLSRQPKNPEHRPRVYLGPDGSRKDHLAYAGGFRVKSNRELNIISTANTLAIIRAFYPDGELLQTSAPSPLGLPGGYPVSIQSGVIELNLPPSVSLNEIVEFQWLSSKLDGVENIADDGTIFFTEKLQEQMRKLDNKLALPLHPEDAFDRFQVLRKYL